MNQMIAKLWETIDIKNASLSTCLATKLNLTLIKEAKVCPLFLVGAFAFPNEIPTFPNFLRAIESQTNLKGSIRVEARAKHYAILAHKEEDILMIQSIIEEKGNLITNQLESSCIWKINHNTHLWGIKIRLPYQVKIVIQKKNVTGLQNQKNATSFGNSDECEFSTFSFSSHSGNG